MDAFSKMIAMCMVVIGIMVVPTLIFSQQNDQITQEYVSNSTVKFVDNVLVQGKITRDMYEMFIGELDATGMIFDIEIEYAKSVLTPAGGGTYNTTQECYYFEDVKNALYRGGDEGTVIDGAADGVLHLVKGDYLSVMVRNKDATHADMLRRTVMRVWSNRPAIEVNYGGEVRDENY